MKKIVSIFVSLSLLLCNLISVNANDNTAKNNQKISYLSEPEARCFIGFIFNNYKEDDKKEKTDGIYELLTGQLSGYDEEVAIVQFVNLMETQITYSIGKWDENSEKTKELIIDYLKTKSNGDMTNDIVNSTLGDISKTFIEYFKDEYLINGHGLEDMEFENLEKGILMGKFIKDINNFPDKVNAYRNEMLTIMISTFFVTSTNRKEMYNYFYNYYNLLDIKYNYGQDAFDLVKSTNELYNEQLAIIKLIEPTLANWSFLDDNMLLWATDDRISLIQKWAELAYQLKNKVLNEAKSNQNDNAESPSDKDIQTNTHYNEIDTNDLQYTLTNEGAVINKYNGSLSYAKIPNEIEGYKVIKINDNAFSNNKLLKYILIPGCVKIIGSKAFQNCVNLQKVIISNGDIVIKEKAFSVYRNMIINSKVYEIDTGLGTTLCSSSNSNVEEYANNSGNKFESTDWDGKTKTEVYPVGDIYYINTPAELAWLTTKNRNINYFKDKIIDISGTFNMNNKDFTPIGASFCNESLLNSEMSKVKEINLNNAKINELKVCLFGISYVDSKNGGLFGSVLANTVKVKECIFSNTNIDQYNHYTENYVGTIFGSLQIEDGGSIEIDDNKFGGNVCARQVYTGGIIGRLILNNGNCNIKNYYSTMNVGGTVQYLDSMTAGGIIGKLINNGKVNISACNVEGNIESEAGLNTVSQCHPGEVGGLIGRVENNGIINIDKVNLDFSAHATCGSYDAAHIGTAIAYLERNTGNIEINNTRNVINKNKGTYNLLIGRGSMARDNVKISNSYFIINGNNSYLDGCSSYMNCYDNSYILDNGNVTCHVYDNDLDIAKEGKEKLLSSFRTNVEMKNVSNYKNWDFNNIWYMENDGYPHLMCLDNKELYTITAKAMDGGYISNEGTAKIKKGGRIEYTILPNDNKKVSRIVVDGIEQPIENTYIFENINENHTIVVYFEEKEYRKINYILNGGKLVDGTPTKHYLGSITTLVPPIKEGKTFMGWYNNSSFEGNSISEISYDDSEINLYAKWCSFVEIEYAFIGTYQEIVNTTKPFEYCEYVEEGKSLQEFRIKLNKQYCFTKNILEKISFSNNNSGLKVKIENDSELIFYGNIENNIYVKVGESGKIIKYTKPKIKNLGNKIGNTNSSMEYTDSLELENWRDCEENETFVSQGKYYVRYKENDRVLASDLVEIIIKKTVTGIKVTPPSKVGYVEGQGLQLTGGSIEITYNDGTKENKDLTEEMISGYDKSKVGEQEIKVSYGNQETTFKVSVIKKTVTGINDKNEIVNTDFIKTGDGINFIENIFFNFISLVGFSILFIFERRKRI